MCNLCSNRLFLVGNPCCCCTLRCGTIWAGILDFLYGGISLLVPVVLGKGFEIKSKSLDPNAPKFIYAERLELEGKFSWLSMEEVRHFQTYGCYGLQTVTGLYLAICIRCFASPFNKFVAGSIWLIARTIITIAWIPLPYAILGPENRDRVDPAWHTYAYILIMNTVVHIYFFIVIRFYTMEAYDIWRYRPTLQESSSSRRRGPQRPDNIKSDKKTNKQHTHRKSKLGGFLTTTKKHFKSRQSTQFEQQHQHKIEHQWDDAPVWRVRGDLTLYGEDYTHWDPGRFHRQWTRLQQTGILKLGEKEVFDEERYRQLVNVDDGPSMDLLEIVDETLEQPFEVESTPKVPTEAPRRKSRKKYSTLTVKKANKKTPKEVAVNNSEPEPQQRIEDDDKG